MVITETDSTSLFSKTTLFWYETHLEIYRSSVKGLKKQIEDYQAEVKNFKIMPDGTCIGFSLHYTVHMTKITHIYIIGTIDKSAEAEVEHYQDSSKPPGLQLWFVLWEMIGWQLPLDFTAFIYIDSKFNNELTLHVPTPTGPGLNPETSYLSHP